MDKNITRFDLFVLLLIIVYGFALYLPSLQSKSFYLDDKFSIVNNASIRNIDIPKIFNAFNTRFLVGFSFALNYKWCGLNPHSYRTINFLIHCFNAFLVYLLIKSTLYLYAARKPVFFCRLEWPALFASLLFLCHPIQTETINFITQRFVLMGSFFYLLTLFLYIQYRCRFKKRYLIASCGSAVAAMLCKEFVVTLPIMIVLYDFYFLGALAETWWQRCSRIWPFFVIVLIVPILLSRTPPEAIGVANIADNTESHIDITRAHAYIGRKQYFLTELNVVRTYVRLMFLPVNQNFDYDYPITKNVDKLTLLSGVFLFFLLALAWATYTSNRLISFGILWFFIALSVESSFIPIGHVIAEYRLYLASVGFVFLVMDLIFLKQADLKKLQIITAGILIGLSILTYQRNNVWRYELALWNDTIHKSPHKARPYLNRALAYYDQGYFARSILDFNKYNEIYPKFADGYYDRGNAYFKLGNFVKAIVDYNKAIGLNPKDADYYNNRALAEFKIKKYDQSWTDVHQAEELGHLINAKFLSALKRDSGREK